jgi:hypothetical protein
MLRDDQLRPSARVDVRWSTGRQYSLDGSGLAGAAICAMDLPLQGPWQLSICVYALPIQLLWLLRSSNLCEAQVTVFN